MGEAHHHETPGMIVMPAQHVHRRHKVRKLAYKKAYFVPFVVIVALLIVYFVRDNTNVAGEGVCSSGTGNDLIAQAAPLFNGAQQTQLQQLVSKIQKLPHYGQDPNCLYAVVIYYINQSDAQDAARFFNMLNKVYEPSVGFSEYHGYNPETISELRAQVSFLQTSFQQAQLNKPLTAAQP
jgi:hypothetical protein